MLNQPYDRRALMGAGLAGVAFAALFTLRTPAEASTGSFKLTDAEWRRRLGPQRYEILRHEGTERAGTSPLLNEHRKGTFVCAGCALPLYASATKFESGTGWPSFYAALPGKTAHKTDTSLFMARVEEHCARCGGHLGHVFDDGPKPTGKRHCINGLSLKFKPA